MRLSVPYPPSINHYYRHVGNKVLISEDGRDYRQRIAEAIAAAQIDSQSERLAVRLRIHAPDRRRRDLDNVQKPLLDALQHGGAYEDDSQIDWLLTERKDIAPPLGLAVVDAVPHKPSGRCPLCGHRKPLNPRAPEA